MNDPNAGAVSFFATDHRECDTAWGAVEDAVTSGDPVRGKAAWEAFRARLERHFRMEEEVLFPAFEETTGMQGQGPTAVMRAEHQQMRGLLGQMAREAEAGNLQAVLDHGDTLLMLVQQHNAKEEGMLYPMADQVLAPRWTEIAGALGRYAV